MGIPPFLALAWLLKENGVFINAGPTLIHVMKALLNESIFIMGRYCFFPCLNTFSLFVWLILRKLLSNLLCGSNSYCFSHVTR